MLELNKENKNKIINNIKIGDDCWEWTGGIRNDEGYGYLCFSGMNYKKRQVAHRVVYEIFIGDIPDNMDLDHLCRNRKCVNPWHLEPVTRSENVKRGEAGKYQTLRTHCPKGHERNSQNTGTRTTKEGKVKHYCKVCSVAVSRAWQLRKYEEKGITPVLNSEKTHCPKGHEYSEENTYINPNSKTRTCKTCQKEAQIIYNNSVKEGKEIKRRVTHCKRGHDLSDPAFGRLNSTGRIDCRECKKINYQLKRKSAANNCK